MAFLDVQIESDVFADLDVQFRTALENKFISLSNQLYQKVQENLSGKILRKQSGQLAGSIRQEVDISGDILTAVVGPQPATEKAWALEYGGSKSYGIYPVKARVLRFYWDKVGQIAYFTAVNHPPSEEYAYLRSALMEMEPIVAMEMKQMAESILGQ